MPCKLLRQQEFDRGADSCPMSLSFPTFGRVWWGRASPCAGRVARLFEYSTRLEQRARGARAGEASAPQKLSVITLKACATKSELADYPFIDFYGGEYGIQRYVFVSRMGLIDRSRAEHNRRNSDACKLARIAAKGYPDG